MSEVRENALRVWVAPEEKAQIQTNAESCSLSCSAYLRNLGLGYTPASKLDATAMRQLAKVNGDMGRLGGLLKMLLTNQERRAPEVSRQIESLLNEIAIGQGDLRFIANRLKA